MLIRIPLPRVSFKGNYRFKSFWMRTMCMRMWCIGNIWCCKLNNWGEKVSGRHPLQLLIISSNYLLIQCGCKSSALTKDQKGCKFSPVCLKEGIEEHIFNTISFIRYNFKPGHVPRVCNVTESWQVSVCEVSKFNDCRTARTVTNILCFSFVAMVG